jgi:two-component SAPR family response regulator
MERLFKCESCKIDKPLSDYHRKPNIRYHYHQCKMCNVKYYIKDYIAHIKTANKHNITLNELKRLKVNEIEVYDDYLDELFSINDENIKNEGEILYEILYNKLSSENKQLLNI